ncbi:hypothetical protein LTSEMIN_6410, partial [Salmonella enterica subsp. enterica serovar Minnesota str. A4-603]
VRVPQIPLRWPGATPQEVERLADGLRARGVAKLILPALYL